MNIYRGGQLLAVYETGANCSTSMSDFVDAFFNGAHYSNSTARDNAITTLTQSQAQGQGNLIAAAQALAVCRVTSTALVTERLA